MALPPPPPPPPLLLLLLLLGAGAQDLKVEVTPEVRGRLGGTVDLPCRLLPTGPDVKVSQVTWVRWDGVGRSYSVAVSHPEHGASYPDPETDGRRLKFLSAGLGGEAALRDATLQVRELRAQDQGNYTCEFATFPRGNSKGATWLRVEAEPRNQAWAQEVTQGSLPTTVTFCVSAAGLPAARLSWSTSLTYKAKVTQEELPNGTVTVTSQLTLLPTRSIHGQTVTCKVEHETLQEPQMLPVTLVIRHHPEVTISSYDDNWFIGRSDATLNCDAQSYPEPTVYEWSTLLGPLPPTVVVQGSRLVVHTVDSQVNTTFVCSATNAVGTGRAEQTILVRENPNPAGSGATGGIIGGIIASIIAMAVIATAVLICRQQRKERSPQGDSEEDDLGGPPAYKPPPPKVKLEEPEVPLQLYSLDNCDHAPLKTPYFEPSVSTTEQDTPRYHELPTLEERVGGSGLRGPEPQELGEEEEEEDEDDDYLDKINPIYDALAFAAAEAYQKGFVMSRAMYV
ncbi:nectin-2 isoform X3 [Tachyglossus aculeatus]|uniref:nectin-2 isoform X3 n=1 Tax=Tachyglossus aculeatus TaxID=9261 RepID=UPI0018F4D576|nr:nectin-2 isoform X3 [Tachyglossus aculeatus]